MVSLEIEKSSDPNDFTTYFCPHCEEPLAVGTLFHLKAICPNCEKLFVIVGLSQEENKNL